MSTYQYYEFQAVDRPLTPAEQGEVARLSSRVDPHPWRAVFTYHWSDLPGRAEDILARYYDAMLYVANWGSRRLMFRFPRTLVDVEQLRQYDVTTPMPGWETVSVEIVGGYAVLDIELSEEEGVGWIDCEGSLGSLLELRNAILRQDYRALYLAWLKGLEIRDALDRSALEPPVPPGLGELTPALCAFIQLFEIDRDLLGVAAERSSALVDGTLSNEELRRALERLPTAERDAFLLRLARGEPHLSLILRRRLNALVGWPEVRGEAPRRTAGEILAMAAQRKGLRREAQAAAAEVRRIKRLKGLAQRADAAWDEVESLIQEKQGKAYDEAVRILAELRELSEFQHAETAYADRVRGICERYSRRTGLLRRLRDAGLMDTDDKGGTT